MRTFLHLNIIILTRDFRQYPESHGSVKLWCKQASSHQPIFIIYDGFLLPGEADRIVVNQKQGFQEIDYNSNAETFQDSSLVWGKGILR